MPVSGGAADKIGNRYEALWAVDRLLRIIEGAAVELTLEPIDPDESRGIEFRLVVSDEQIEYWSIKRQTARAAGWTLATLAMRDARRRTILGDLLEHVARKTSYYSVFASTLAAPDLDEILDHVTKGTLRERFERSSDLKREFQGHVLPLCGNDYDRTCELLKRVRTHAVDEKHLREHVALSISRLLYNINGSSIDTESVRLLLAEFLLERLHQPICKGDVLEVLNAKGIGRRDWAIERSVSDRVEAMCDEYVGPVRSQFINHAFLTLPGADALYTAQGKPACANLLVVGGAGAGKSSTLAAAVENFRSNHIPILPIRLDQIPEGIFNTVELGRKFGLPESPVFVLGGIARGGPCVLVIDQLDAVSTVSGRNVGLWLIFDALRREAQRIPRLSLLVGCRAFDVEHDSRMRTLRAEDSGFRVIELGPLTSAQIDSVLRSAGIASRTVVQSLMPVLATPLHLSMFLSLPRDVSTGVRGHDELMDCFWEEKERATSRRLGRSARWTPVIDQLTSWLSDNQQTSAPKRVLDDYRDDADAMTSEHVLVLAEKRYRFFHDSFFDYAFARRFAGGGQSIVDLLISGEQYLFRRAQVRQVLAYLRVQDWPRYLVELEAVLKDRRVRFHITNPTSAVRAPNRPCR